MKKYSTRIEALSSVKIRSTLTFPLPISKSEKKMTTVFISRYYIISSTKPSSPLYKLQFFKIAEGSKQKFTYI
jgi:hypothetical protein